LINSAASADVLICLDAVSAVLRHPRKLVLLLDDMHLAPGEDEETSNASIGHREYVANTLRSSLKEAVKIFVLSRYAANRLKGLSGDEPQVLAPYLPSQSFKYPRSSGSELLVLGPLTDRQRPELLVNCLADLPDHIRARCIAPHAAPSDVARINALALNAGIDQRLAIDTRQINEGEKAYTIARAGALLELARGALAAGPDVYRALESGVPVIACNDGGALAEVANLCAQPDGSGLAKTARAAVARPHEELVPGTEPLSEFTSVKAWSPLMEAITQ
jgi:hypothetical protein